MIIRPEKPEDHEGIRDINMKAFETEAEANLVEALRKSGVHLISLVAEEKGTLVGHILFSPVSLEGNPGAPPMAGLAPMAVLPERQRQGIGSRLIKEGLEYCSRAGYAAVVVLGHPDYYSRFGFVPSITFNLRSAYDVPEEVFMINVLLDSALNGLSGTVKYHQAFDEL